VKSRSTTERHPARPTPAVAWHALSADEALQRLQTRPDGLTSAEAAERRAAHGPNVIPRGRRDTALDLVWRQIHNPLIWVLIAAAVVAMAVDPTDGIKNGLVILAVVVINTFIGFVQEFKAGKAIEALSRMVPENAAVLRDGRKVTVPATDLVPGDVVLLASGDRVPADTRLIQLRNLQVEEAALTGESAPVGKVLAPAASGAGIGDRTCLAFGGTLVTYGAGTAVVVETGARTELGRISTMLKETTDLQTPLTRALKKIGWTITIAIVAIALAMLAFGTWRTIAETGVGWLTALRETVIFAVALAVGSIPEGLPAIVTIALAIGVQRMAARHAVVRKLPAVETLGSTTVICSDKTGTLTRNEMTVQALWTPASGRVLVSGVGYAPTGQFQRDGAALDPLPPDATELLLAGALCNDASLEQAEGQWKIHGDPTEGALVVAAEKAGLAVGEARRKHQRMDAIPFESEHRFMATLHPWHGGRIVVKGAPEVLLRRCTKAAGAAFNPGAVLHEVETLAADGMRVLAFAAKSAPGRTGIEIADVASGLELLGLQGMMDPPRPEAIAAIEQCQRAGVTVKMITGDHKATAQAIAAQLNILPADPSAPRALAGAELAEMSEQEWDEAAHSCNVFARVAPEHKLKLVRALQADGQVVAMTGDGVNDAPALKQANIGVAMGITGTSVSKESAAIVLTDDNFASIAAAVEEGRRVYDNLIKALGFVLPTNLGLALILASAVAFFPFGDVTRVVDGAVVTLRELLLPLTPAQLLWINLVAAVALALPLAFEAKEPDVMSRPPRDPKAPVLSGFIVMRTLVVAALMTAGAVGLFLHAYRAAGGGAAALATAQTMAVTTVVMFQIFYLFNCRSLRDSILKIGAFSNPTVFAGIGAILALQALFVYAPFMHAIFGSAPLAVGDVLVSVAVGAVILPVVGLEKWLRRRARARRR
jgi:Ca2+-transporting ATPase